MRAVRLNNISQVYMLVLNESIGTQTILQGWAEAKALGSSYSQMVKLLEINCEWAFRFIRGTLDED